MASEVLISFCIPTYNRAKMLGPLLDALVDQKANLPIEIVVCDNCSSDGTGRLLQEYARDHGIRWQRNEENLGASRNLLAVMRLARGKYAWVLSDDDMPVPGAVARVIDVIRARPELAYLFVSRRLVDVGLRPLSSEAQPKGVREDVFFADGREIFTACNGQMGDLMGYYSSTVVEKAAWDRALKSYRGPIDSWILARILLGVVVGRHCGILAEAGILARVGNSTAGEMSQIWLDECVDLYQYAMRLGYSRGFCERKIVWLFQSNSMRFVLNKAAGKRTGSMRSIARRAGVEGIIGRATAGWYLSLLPAKVLRPLLWAQRLRRLMRARVVAQER